MSTEPISMACQKCGKRFVPRLMDPRTFNVDAGGETHGLVTVECPHCDLVMLVGIKRWQRGDLPQTKLPSRTMHPDGTESAGF